MSTTPRKKRSRAGAAAELPPPPTPHEEEEGPAPEMPQAGSGEATAVVDYAKSSRSTCRVCNEPIKQGELRLGFEVEMRRRAPGHAAVGWRHLECFHPPVGMQVSHLSGASLLSAGDKARVARRLRAAARDAERRHLGPPPPGSREATPLPSAPPQRKKRHPEEYAARGTEGRHAAAAQARAHEHPGDSRFSLTPGEGASPERASRIRAKYDEMHVDELKEVLKANEQLLSGAKAALEERCTDGELRGGLPACPTCGVGRIHVTYEKGGKATYACPGYFDTEARTFIRCPFVSNQVERTPWVMPGGAAQRAPGVA